MIVIRAYICSTEDFRVPDLFSSLTQEEQEQYLQLAISKRFAETPPLTVDYWVHK